MPRPVSPDVVYRLTGVSHPALSPGGDRLAFVETRVEIESMETRSRIEIVDLPAREPRTLTDGVSDISPGFSPDGETVAFLRGDDAGQRQLWSVSSSGGEPRQLTSLPGGVAEHDWSPDSRCLVAVSDVDPEQPRNRRDAREGPSVRVARRIRYRADTIGWRGDAFRHLFVVDVQTGEARQLTDGEGEDSCPAWSPDGTRIAFISDRLLDRDIRSHSECYVVPQAGGEPKLWSPGLSSVSTVTWSPDGTRLAVIGSDDEEAGAGWQGWVFVLDSHGSLLRLTDDSMKPEAGYAPVIPPPEMRWTSDGRILILASARGETYLYEVSVENGGQRKVAGGGMQLSDVSFDQTAGKGAMVGIPPTSAGDLYMIDLWEGSKTQLTNCNQRYFDEHPPADIEKFTISRGGIEIESRVLLPPDFDPSRRYPMVVDIHGGPHGAFYDAFNPVQQVLATSGFIVLAANPRGSSTYGVEFMKEVLRDWGGEDYLDIMAAVDEVCSRPYVDASRLGVTGYSYGGFMSSWIVGHDTRFGAAVVGAPCTNLSSMYGTSDIGVRFGEVQWGGTRDDELETFLKRSPLTYAANVETPVLLLHGEADARCPIEQSEQYFVALKRLGKEVEFVRFPGCSHMFLRNGHPRMRREYLSRMLSWFENHLAVDTPMGGC